jgi:16S rRNA (guanine527-N7)-methyltransferase
MSDLEPSYIRPNVELWTRLAAGAGIALTENQMGRLGRYLDLLLEANQKMNLTRISDRGAAEVQHVGDALTALRYLPSGAIRIADVGTGGGVPGIPLAIVRPEARVLLVEATKKKAAFLASAKAALDLKNVEIAAERAEEVGYGRYRETMDVAIARAVATMDWLAEWCLPLVKVNGSMLAMKGPRVAEELPAAARAIKLMGGGEAAIHPVELPGSDHRVIVEIRKINKSDRRYPRTATAAKGKAL